MLCNMPLSMLMIARFERFGMDHLLQCVPICNNTCYQKHFGFSISSSEKKWVSDAFANCTNRDSLVFSDRLYLEKPNVISFRNPIFTFSQAIKLTSLFQKYLISTRRKIFNIYISLGNFEIHTRKSWLNNAFLFFVWTKINFSHANVKVFSFYLGSSHDLRETLHVHNNILKNLCKEFKFKFIKYSSCETCFLSDNYRLNPKFMKSNII